jgi:protein-disulfide isomerase/rhodanese-related sulfurtransferase/uncharacterized membrane protein
MRKLLLLAVSLVGLLDSSYLWWTYTTPSRPMVCIGEGCDVVRASSYAHLWGLPLPLYGAGMYVVLAVLIFVEPLLSAPLARRSRQAVAGISGWGFLFSMYLTGLEAFVLHAWCTWCTISAVALTFIFALALLDLLRPLPPPEPAAALARVRSYLAVTLLVLAVGVPSFVFIARSGAAPPAPQARPETLAERIIRPDSHMVGNPQALVTVVEFGDIECPACEFAEANAREIRRRYGSVIRFVFRQFPLERIHPQAEKAAEASECAAAQGKFWEALDKFYDNHRDLSVPALARYAGELGLDVPKFNQCLSSGAMGPRVRRDLADARALGLRATPTFFVGDTVIEGNLPVGEFAKLLEQQLASRIETPAPSAPQPAAASQPKPTPSPPPSASAVAPQAASSPSSGLLGKTTSSAAPAQATSSPSSGLLGKTTSAFFTPSLSSATVCSEEEAAAEQQPTLIGTAQARQLFEGNPKAVFVDVRAGEDFNRGRIAGALNIPANEMAGRWESLPKDRRIVLYESGESAGDVCGASRAAGRILLAHGFAADRVAVYEDGLAGWEKAGLPLER